MQPIPVKDGTWDTLKDLEPEGSQDKNAGLGQKRRPGTIAPK